MTASQGFFIHIPTGQIVSIHEHASAVIESPERFGVPIAAVAGLSPVQDRREILELVFQNDWARIRHRKYEVSVEFKTDWNHTLESIACSIDELGCGEFCWLNFHQLGSDEALGVHVHELRRHYEEGTISDLVGRVSIKIMRRRK